MYKGTISDLRRDHGFITTARGKRMFFNRGGMASDTNFNDLCVGATVEYETEQEPDGRWRAVNVRLLELPGTEEQQQTYKFLNPYNFVRFVTARKEKQSLHSAPSKSDIALLGRCTPPPHDRYLGLTGKIICELEAVTPLFVSDSENVDPDKPVKGHNSYEFFKLSGKHAIPATSLRGMVRTVFEAVTNSCFSTVEDRQLDYRMAAKLALSLHPAVITKLPNTTSGQDGEVQLLKSAWLHRSLIEDAASSVLSSYLTDAPWSKEEPFSSYFDKVLKDQLLPIQVTVVQKVKRRSAAFCGKFYSFPFNEVTAIQAVGQVGQELQKPNGNNFWGYLKITGPNVIVDRVQGKSIDRELRKHDERFFYWDGLPEIKAKIPYKDVENRENAVQRYNAVRETQKNPASQQLPYETYIQNERLSVGDLVWVSVLKDKDNANVVVDIGNVSIPKLRYRHGILDLLPNHLHPCSKHDELCPACRVFGWVSQSSPKDNVQKTSPVAYAGRVEFSHGQLTHNAGMLPKIPLAILSSPKPTTTLFYLRPRSSDQIPQKWPDDKGYDGDNLLRGRKFYRHHSAAQEREYRRKDDVRNDQNRTVRDSLKPGAKFKFTVRFNNLAPVELGALLWALEVGGNGFHRLGFAKPLGFGSVKVKIEDVQVLDPSVRYGSLADSGWRPLENWEAKCVQAFKDAFAERYNYHACEFDSMPNIEDLRALLNAPSSGLPIHYPRTDRVPSRDGKNFEWFMGNKKNRNCYALGAANEDSGLPLLDKDGNEIN